MQFDIEKACNGYKSLARLNVAHHTHMYKHTSHTVSYGKCQSNRVININLFIKALPFSFRFITHITSPYETKQQK